MRNTDIHGKNVCIFDNASSKITCTQDALDLMITAKHEHECTRIAVAKENLNERFFVLSSGFAGEVLQKFVNYQMKLAVYGDFSEYTSKALRDFIYESNKGNAIFFVASEQEAIERLGAV